MNPHQSSLTNSDALMQRTELAITSPGSRPTQLYADYTQMSVADNVISGSLTIVTLFKDVADLIPHAGPLSQVLGVVRELISVVCEMNNNRDGCEHLTERILKFMKNLVEESTQMNVPLQHGTPTAARLYALLLNIEAIKRDIDEWKQWNTWKRLRRRGVIKAGISKHGINLSDCFHTFVVRSVIQQGALADNAAVSPITTSTSGILASSDRTHDDCAAIQPAILPGVTTPSIDSAGLQQLFQQSAGKAMFGQLNRGVRSRLGELGKPGCLVDKDTQYLTNQIECLTTEISDVLPSVEYTIGGDSDQVATEPFRHIQQTGNPIRQLRQTLRDTFDILSRLQGTQNEISAEDMANKMSSLSRNLHDLGMRREALGVQTFCVVLYRGLQQQHAQSKSCSRNFVESLTSLAWRLSNLGHREEALDIAQESVGLCRKLAMGDPTFEPYLAKSVDRLSNCLSDLGYREEALKAVLESVQLRRRLASSRPAIFNPDFALSLNNLSVHLYGLHRQEEALEASRESAGLYRQLATDKPADFNVHLAMTLNNLSNPLSELGRNEEALRAKEATELYRQLSADRPAAFNPDFAVSLNNLSNSLSDVGHREEALQTIREAVGLFRQLAPDQPAAFIHNYAMALNNLSGHLFDLGHLEEALQVIKEAVGQYQQLTNDRPAVFKPYLAISLSNLSEYLDGLGYKEEALLAAQEAEKISST